MKRIFNYLILIVFITVLGFIAFLLYETKDEIKASNENIEEKINSLYQEEKLGGFAVSVFSQDSIIYMKGFGYADKENKIPYTKSTQQYIASISKTTIGLSLMKARELGLVDLDESIDKYLGFKLRNPHFPNQKITLRHLATHTSSLDYNEKVVESLYVNETQKRESLKPFIEDYFLQKKYGEIFYTSHRPGENYNYSNIGAGLAAYIIESTSGLTYAEFSKKYIFKPMNLTNTFWYESEADRSKLTKYYEARNASLIEVETSGVILYPCRDMITDIRDLTSYCQSLISRNPKILSSASFEELLKPQLKNTVSNQSDDNSGLFFLIDRNEYGITYQLTGGTGGDHCINSIMLFDPYTQLGYIFIGNTGSSKENRVNHLLIYRTLVSLGDRYAMENPDKVNMGNIKFSLHNYFNRIRAFF